LHDVLNVIGIGGNASALKREQKEAAHPIHFGFFSLEVKKDSKKDQNRCRALLGGF
jgi:hypothetical protein